MKKNHFPGFGSVVVILLFLLSAVLSLLLVGKVAINYDISDYLDEKTETKISLHILESEFGMTSDIQVMIQDITVDAAKDVQKTLENIPNVLTVNFDAEDEGYFKDGNALFVVLVDGDEYSDAANTVSADITKALDATFEGKTNYGGAVVEKANLREAIEREIPLILAISLCLVVAIMLLTSKSWLEPLVLLLASGVAILLNMGTNAILGEISYITNAVSAILQLALSIDYSIVLLHSYRALKAAGEDREKAMRRAIKDVVRPVSASALTTIAGLLALLFMSFKIGFDIGAVLMKGIVISAITSLTLFPALLLLFDGLMSKTEKRELVFKGTGFCKLSFKAGKLVVPVALALIIACGVLQLGNAYSFTDSKNTNDAIANTFGQSNSIVVVYPKNESNHAGEIALADKLNAYKTANGTPVLKGYSAYSNTVRALYDVDMAAKKLNLPTTDVEMLLTMYHLYNDPSLVKMNTLDFIRYADQFMREDQDALAFTDEKIASTMQTLLAIHTVMSREHTAEEFHSLVTTGALAGTNLDLFSVKQLYGLYVYDEIADKAVDFETMLDYLIAASAKEETAGMLDEQTVQALTALSQGIKQFEAQVEMPLTRAQFQGYMYQNYGASINDMVATQIYASYYLTLGQAEQETIPFLSLMNFLASQNLISEPTAVAQISAYNALYAAVNTTYTYEAFLPALSHIATGLSGTQPTLQTPDAAVQQLYIMYFYEQSTVPSATMLGSEFIDFVKQTMAVNPVVSAQFSDSDAAKLSDICDAYASLQDPTAYDFREMTDNLAALQNRMQSISSDTTIGADKISGLYIKYAIAHDLDLAQAVEAKDILDFVSANMDTHELLKVKISDENREKINDLQSSLADVTALFIGESYSRMLLSVNLPGEGEDATAFIEFLSAAVADTFGAEAHIAGKIVSTYDLQTTFDSDNTFISIFTIISIFVIVMLVFRSLSLPVVLVTIIQGAIWIAMSTSLLTGPMFFMSYIIATCILMGATIDYGILMSTNYTQYRQTLDKKTALLKSVEAALPTVFTSGAILIICGFVIGFIASQGTIATVGILIGKGTLVSVLMIVLVLPSVLYLLDRFILKLSLKRKQK